MTNPNKKPNRSSDEYRLKLSAPTLFAIAVAAVLIPLLLTGFISQ